MSWLLLVLKPTSRLLLVLACTGLVMSGKQVGLSFLRPPTLMIPPLPHDL